MVAPNNEEFWVNCVLTSQSGSKVLYLNKANLEILEKTKIKVIQRVYLQEVTSNLLDENAAS